jgi:hypothetical protein
VQRLLVLGPPQSEPGGDDVVQKPERDEPGALVGGELEQVGWQVHEKRVTAPVAKVA